MRIKHSAGQSPVTGRKRKENNIFHRVRSVTVRTDNKTEMLFLVAS